MQSDRKKSSKNIIGMLERNLNLQMPLIVSIVIACFEMGFYSVM